MDRPANPPPADSSAPDAPKARPPRPICALLSGGFLFLFWAGIFSFARFGLDLGYATPLVFALVLVAWAGLLAVALGCALAGLARMERPLGFVALIAFANVATIFLVIALTNVRQD